MQRSRRQFLAATGGAALGALAARWRSAAAQNSPLTTFRGVAGKSTQGPISLLAGLTVVRAQHNGTANFIVDLDQPNPGTTIAQAQATAGFVEGHGLFNVIGRLNGGTAVLVAHPGDFYFVVDAAGAYQLTVEQPLPETVTPLAQQTFSGQGSQVTPYFSLAAGSYTVTAQGDSNSSNLVVWLYNLDDLGGSAVSPNYDGKLIDAGLPTTPNVAPFSAAADGVYLFAVYTDTNDLGQWTISVQ